MTGSVAARVAIVVALSLLTLSTATAAAGPTKQIRFQDLPSWNVQITMRIDANLSSIEQIRAAVVESDAEFAELSARQQREELVALSGDAPPPGYVEGTQWRVQARRADRRSLARRVRHQEGVSSAQVGTYFDPVLEACEHRDKGVRLEVYMDIDATPEEIDAVRAAIDTSPIVEKYDYIDKAAALAEFTRIFRKDPDLVKSIKPDSLPTYFRVVPKEDREFKALVREVVGLRGANDIATPEETLPDLDCARLAAIS